MAVMRRSGGAQQPTTQGTCRSPQRAFESAFSDYSVDTLMLGLVCQVEGRVKHHAQPSVSLAAKGPEIVPEGGL